MVPYRCFVVGQGGENTFKHQLPEGLQICGINDKTALAFYTQRQYAVFLCKSFVRNKGA